MLAVGHSVGNYVIRSLLGEGGMGQVYLAEHPLIGRRVAIKVIHQDLAHNTDAVSRFFTEAQSVNRIGHPNIVDITDFGRAPNGESYFVMELLSGESLGARIKRGPLQILDALYITQQVADALAASHSSGILHRDLKPDNIYLTTRGQDAQFVKVLDFGLAKLTHGSDQVSHRTRTGSVMGTPYYMAPEQCAGKADIDARADVYAMGVIIYEMLTGTVPFTGEGYGAIIVQHMTEPAPRVLALRPDCPAWLDEMVARMLVKERKERVQSMDELRETIVSCLGGGNLPHPPPRATAPSLFEPPKKKQKSSSRAIILAGAGASVAAGVVAVLLISSSGGKAPAPAPTALPVAAAAVDAAPVAVAPAVPDAAPAATPPPSTPAKVAIHFESDPPGATIVLSDGTEVGTTPFDWMVAPSDKPVDVSFKKDGYETRARQVTPRQATSLVVDLPKAKKIGKPQPPVTRPEPSKPEPTKPEPPKPEPPKPKPDDDLMLPGN